MPQSLNLYGHHVGTTVGRLTGHGQLKRAPGLAGIHHCMCLATSTKLQQICISPRHSPSMMIKLNPLNESHVYGLKY